ncbi:MAG: CDP-diacylglycerol--glycerol-3-phosphate 3-phosphatidyltransferase [Pseudomonadota bacterium]|nr:CDP-diacylglycerol--glycerol-3-phosphate 3-phosphatidyltransferase [Pseudomonadota bacterium]
MFTSVPNLLTLSRIVLIPVVVALMFFPGKIAAWSACACFTVAAITDWFDGYLARSWKQVSPLGRFMDPIADKLLVAAVLLMLVAADRLQGLAVVAAVIILLREVLVSGLREFLAELDVSVPVSRLAKWKTAIQMIALGFLIVGDYGPPDIPVLHIGIAGLWVAAGLTLFTGWDYLTAGMAHMKGPDISPPPDGPPPHA